MLALALVAPSLVSGFALDDYVLLYQMARPGTGEWAGSAPFDLFRWMDPAHDHRLMDGGGMPWWTFEQATCAFMRPISSLTHAFDHWLWPTNPFLMHLQSVVWFAILLVLAFTVYSKLIESRWVAGLAGAMFALDSAHGTDVGWISNRNALIGGVFGIGTLLFHHRRRAGAHVGFALLAWLCFGLSLTSAELSLCIAGYLVAYALLYEQNTLRQRLLSMVPYAIIFVIWAGLRHAGHYGVNGLGAYVDPLKDPQAFIGVLPTRAVLLLSSQIGRLGSDLYDMLPTTLQPALLLGAVAVCAMGFWFVAPTIRANRSIRFWAAGAVLSVVPLAASLPSDRLLTLVGLGVMPTLAQAIHDAFFALRGGHGEEPRAVSRNAAMRGGYATLLTLVHLVADPLMLPALALSPAMVAQSANSTEASMPADSAVREKTVIVTEIPDSVMLTYLPVMRSVNGRPRPDKLYWLVAAKTAARYERRGSHVLRVTSPAGFFDRRWEARSPRLAFVKGDRIELSEMTVEVVELTDDGRPTVCDFIFARPLESAAYVWRTWRNGELEPFSVPSDNSFQAAVPAPNSGPQELHKI